MERMTCRHSLDGYVDTGLRNNTSVGDAICRLADYEDTGLEPEEIIALLDPSNHQLTMEELLEMDGEPVWVCAPDGSSGRYGFVCADPFGGPEHFCVTTATTTAGRTAYSRILYFVTYGKTWLAYRRKMEQQHDNN